MTAGSKFKANIGHYRFRSDFYCRFQQKNSADMFFCSQREGYEKRQSPKTGSFGTGCTYDSPKSQGGSIQRSTSSKKKLFEVSEWEKNRYLCAKEHENWSVDQSVTDRHLLGWNQVQYLWIGWCAQSMEKIRRTVQWRIPTNNRTTACKQDGLELFFS